MSSDYSKFKYSVKKGLIRDFNWSRIDATRWMQKHNTTLRTLREEGYKVKDVVEAINKEYGKNAGVL